MPAPEGNDYAVGNEGGRPTEYKDEYVLQAEKLCMLGATDEEVADFFGVSTRTIYRWKLEHDEFCQALKVGKAAADERIERSLYQKASGYFYTEEQAFKIKVEQHKEEVEVVPVEKYAPPDTTAQIFWLKNRKRDDWRDKQEIEHRFGILKDVDGVDIIPGGNGSPLD